MTNAELVAIGTRLDNGTGATVIAARPVNNNTAVVLAMVPSSPHPYVTWIARTDGWGTGSGNYFTADEIAAAVRDFETR